jgi:hypothetical protein
MQFHVTQHIFRTRVCIARSDQDTHLCITHAFFSWIHVKFQIHLLYYVQVQTCLEIFSTAGTGEDEEEDEESNDIETPTHDMRFVLQDPSYLGVLFTVFSECQALHPEEQAEGEGDFMFNEDEVIRANESRLDALLRMPSPGDVDMLTRHEDDDRFADADEDED